MLKVSADCCPIVEFLDMLETRDPRGDLQSITPAQRSLGSEPAETGRQSIIETGKLKEKPFVQCALILIPRHDAV